MLLSCIGVGLMYISTLMASSVYFRYKFPFMDLSKQILTSSIVLEYMIYFLPFFCIGYYLVNRKKTSRAIQILLHCAFMFYMLSNGFGIIFFILSSLILLLIILAIYWLYNKNKLLQEKINSSNK